jgi:hypothetical protein
MEGGLGVVSGKETKTGEGAARVVEPRDTDGVRSLIGYGILLYFFYFPFFSFVTFFFYKARGEVRPKQKKTTPAGANT